jgi:hypothetical protein
MIVSNGSPTQCGQLLSWRNPKVMSTSAQSTVIPSSLLEG